MSQFPEALLEMPQLIFVIGGLIAIVAIVFGTIASVFRAVSTQKTKREIAAYIAEGTMDPEQGIRLLNARDEEKA